jgi:hypothetical protein
MLTAALAAGPVAAASLEPFGSERAIVEFLETQVSRPKHSSGGDSELSEVMVTGFRATSITNNQTAGVDEGGIVKMVGEHLVVLRRGRLFTVSLAGNRMRPVAWIPAYPPNVDADGAWYDEMLVYRDRIVVIGYSNSIGATEINLFRIDAAGGLRYEATWHARSSDYYSASNYASRLLGSKLVFYTALPVSRSRDFFPAVRKLPSFAGTNPPRTPDGDAPAADEDLDDPVGKPFTRIVTARRIYRPPYSLSPGDEPVLHTVTSCDLAAAEFECKATAAFGSYSEVFYVSATAAYVWTSLSTSTRTDEGATEAFVYRMPLDGGAPTALPVAGMPIDQFSFLEAEGHLNVMVAARGPGNWMWNTTSPDDSFALLRVPLAEFGSGRQRFDAKPYRDLPFAGGRHSTPRNRFVGRHLLYGAGDGWGTATGEAFPLHLTRTDGTKTLELAVAHSIDRIEVLGDNAIIVGTDPQDDLHFTGIRLDESPNVAQHLVMPDVEQGELRSHGFFYRALAPGHGILGLPIRSAGSGGSAHLKENSSGVTFLLDDGRDFARFGVLETSQDRDSEDGCVASCTDWYGNARPIFVGERIFALMGYDLVEAATRGTHLVEKARTTFAPFFPK